MRRSLQPRGAFRQEMACRAIIKAVKRVSRQGAAPEHMVRMCDVIGVATRVGARGINNTVEADDVLDAVQEKHPTHEALQHKCEEVKDEVQDVRRELERQSMEVEDYDQVRMGPRMEMKRMRAEDKNVGANIDEEPSKQSRRRRPRRRKDAATSAATGAAMGAGVAAALFSPEGRVGHCASHLGGFPCMASHTHTYACGSFDSSFIVG